MTFESDTCLTVSRPHQQFRRGLIDGQLAVMALCRDWSMTSGAVFLKAFRSYYTPTAFASKMSKRRIAQDYLESRGTNWSTIPDYVASAYAELLKVPPS